MARMVDVFKKMVNSMGLDVARTRTNSAENPKAKRRINQRLLLSGFIGNSGFLPNVVGQRKWRPSENLSEARIISQPAVTRRKTFSRRIKTVSRTIKTAADVS